MPILHESEHTKLMTSLIKNLLLVMAALCQQSFPYEVIEKYQGLPHSSNSNCFPVPSLADFNSAIIFKVSTLIFVCNSAMSTISYHLFSNFRSARQMINPADSFKGRNYVSIAKGQGGKDLNNKFEYWKTSILQAAVFADLSIKGHWFACTLFALCRAGWSWQCRPS